MKVIAENLQSEEEMKGLKQMFNNMDTDGSGTITYDELRTGLTKLGSKLSETEIQQLMEAVREFNNCRTSYIIMHFHYNYNASVNFDQYIQSKSFVISY